MLTAISAILIFLSVIIFHEFGHFIVAKRLGIRVNEFSIGMGPLLFQKQGPETKYAVRALPIGGYVAMEGEEEASNDPRSYAKASVPKRFAVLVAGATMNFVLAILVLLLLYGFRGHEVPVIERFSEKSALQSAGFEIGDRIVEIDGVQIASYDDLLNSVAGLTADEPVPIVAERSGERITHTVTPTKDTQSDRVLIGIVPAMEKDFSKTFHNAMSAFWMMMNMMVNFFVQLFRGAVGLKDLSGPIGIISTIGQASQMGAYSVMLLLAMISVNVGFFNLLPIPALDGGKILFLLIEGVRGKPLPAEKENIVHLIGFVLLMILILIVTFKDVLNLGIFGG